MRWVTTDGLSSPSIPPHNPKEKIEARREIHPSSVFFDRTPARGVAVVLAVTRSLFPPLEDKFLGPRFVFISVGGRETLSKKMRIKTPLYVARGVARRMFCLSLSGYLGGLTLFNGNRCDAPYL